MAGHLEFDIGRHRQALRGVSCMIEAAVPLDGAISSELRWGAMNDRKDIVAVGLLTAQDLERLGEGFSRAYPLEGADSFADVLAKLEAIEWPPAERK